MTVDELFNSFLSLDADQRSEFLDRAIASSQELPFDAEWLGEVRRRSAEVDAGRMKLHDWNEVQQQIHSKYFPDA